MNFAKIIRSSRLVRGTFAGIAGLEIWWRLVLALHGKPLEMSNHNAAQILASGFRFYGHLYLCLGVILGATGIANLLTEVVPAVHISCMLIFGSLYLIICSQLAFKGGSLFGAGDKRGAVLLIIFFACILLFLGGFGAAMSLWADSVGLTESYVNLSIFIVFIIFGVGSYFIELVYLSWWTAK